jgi:hypothetical protein
VALAASDIIFAMDSIPAILSITTDNFLVITSNCFAVLGLRSLFFVLAALQSMFKYLQQALAIILAAVGLKMVLGYFEVHISVGSMMIFMSVVLVGAVLLSLHAGKTEHHHWDVDDKLMAVGRDSLGSPTHGPSAHQNGDWNQAPSFYGGNYATSSPYGANALVQRQGGAAGASPNWANSTQSLKEYSGYNESISGQQLVFSDETTTGGHSDTFSMV